jgi:hypothetical protein
MRSSLPLALPMIGTWSLHLTNFTVVFKMTT